MSEKKQLKILELTDSEIKGLKLERDAHQFLWDIGYLVFSRLSLYAIRFKYQKQKESIERLEITDLDCYGISFGKFLEKKSFLIDCKHRSENVFSHILRLKGISSILGIDNLLILRESVSKTVQHFGDRFNIRLIPNNAFRKRLEQKGRGSFHLGVYKKIQLYYNSKHSSTIDIEAKFSNCFKEMSPFLRIKKLRVLYNEIKNLINYKEEKLDFSLEIYYLFRTFLFSLITITEIASLTIHQSDDHFNDYIEFNLIGDYEFKKKMLDEINKLTNKENSSSRDNKSPLKSLIPTFTKPLKELIRSFHINSNYVQKFLMYNDFMFHEYFLLGKKIDINYIEEEFGIIDKDLFGDWNLKSLEILDEEKTFPIFMVKLFT